MKYALNLAEDGRVLSVTEEQYAPKNAVLVESFPDGDVFEYRYAKGKFVHDPVPTPDKVAKVTVEERVSALEEAMLEMLLGGM